MVTSVVIIASFVLATSAFATVTRFEQDSASVVYSGTWANSILPGHSAGSVSYTSDGTPPVGSATFSFNGTGVKYIAAKWYNRGHASVSVDGGAATIVDLYAPGVAGDTSTVSYQQEVFSATGLSNGPHTLTVTWDNSHNAAATAPYLITVDAFDVTTPDPVVSTTASSPWSVALASLVGLALVGALVRRRFS